MKSVTPSQPSHRGGGLGGLGGTVPRLGAEARVLRLSAETAAKQTKHRLLPEDYALAQ